MKCDKWKLRIMIYSFMVCMASLIVILTVNPEETVSRAERRRLAEKPELTWDNIMDKSFMDDTEKYLLDHFPFRDGLRRVKAYFAYDVLQQKENNGIYVADGHAAKLEYPLNEASVKRLAVKMTGLCQQYFPEQKVWYAIVPDKNYFLAEKNGYPSLNYEQMIRLLSQELAKSADFGYIDIISDLTIDDYYHTDTHWRQERILDVAHHIADAMGVGGTLNFSRGNQAGFTEHEIRDFYGVYYGQAALPMEPDTIVYLTDEVIDAAYVWSLEENVQSGKNGGKIVNPDEAEAVLKTVYQLQKLEDERSLDKYDVFAGGASSLQVIKSPNAFTDKKLIIFRDSYTSSLAPLLLGAYGEITLIDLRYLDSARLGEYVDFTDADILFLYNTSIVNHAEMLK
ncbi:MAG: hypothetical protein K2G55_14635 [Lachnospiraceae bacterium]|nr:hypothetical protein [Lachnospiraceae bacterium]MDE7202926.1 hypothetical protein [Lachnospiraceae bacterium]